MAGRSWIFAALMAAFACTTVVSVAQRYHPYIFPVDVCFARNGVAVGDLADCVEITRQALAEITISQDLYSELESPDSPAICQRECQGVEFCSYYALRPPADYYNEQVIVESDAYYCTLYGWDGARSGPPARP